MVLSLSPSDIIFYPSGSLDHHSLATTIPFSPKTFTQNIIAQALETIRLYNVPLLLQCAKQNIDIRPLKPPERLFIFILNTAEDNKLLERLNIFKWAITFAVWGRAAGSSTGDLHRGESVKLRVRDSLVLCRGLIKKGSH